MHFKCKTVQPLVLLLQKINKTLNKYQSLRLKCSLPAKTDFLKTNVLAKQIPLFYDFYFKPDFFCEALLIGTGKKWVYGI